MHDSMCDVWVGASDNHLSSETVLPPPSPFHHERHHMLEQTVGKVQPNPAGFISLLGYLADDSVQPKEWSGIALCPTGPTRQLGQKAREREGRLNICDGVPVSPIPLV